LGDPHVRDQAVGLVVEVQNLAHGAAAVVVSIHAHPATGRGDAVES
jgi:hypothetical protein